MDKLKPIIDFLKKHLFWILCAIVFLVTAGTYFKGSASLQRKQEDQEKKITVDFKKVSGIKSVGDGFHPNQETHLELVDLTNTAKAELGKAWDLKEQVQRPLFVWPEEIGIAARSFQVLRPIEKLVPFDEERDNSKVPEKDRAAYQELVRNALPPLAAQIGEVWLPVLKRGGISEPQRTAITKAKRVVIWDETNQDYWEEKFTKFKNSYNKHPTGVPWTLQILYAQEDMWILQSILEDVIKKTNGNAAANDLAKIKVIDHIFIGRDAQGIVGNVLIAHDVSAAQGNAGPQGQSGMQEMMMMPGSTSPSTGPVSTANKAQFGDGTQDPANGRYVNQNLEPVGGKTLREAFVNVTAETAYLSIAKRVPVRIGLRMDERAIWELMANCANARLPLEVKQVRLNVHSPGVKGTLAGSLVGSSSQITSGSTTMPMDESIPSGPEGSGAYGGGTVVKSQPVLGGYDASVEIYGIIYIYNPVDPNVVKQIQAGDNDSSGSSPGPTAAMPSPVGRLRS